VVARLAESGWRPIGIDLTIVAARPRLGDAVDAMRASIATSLGLAPEAVSVKASTGNLDGSEGAGRSISTLALATIERRA
jgi:2-C-methyl-D-erythritol 2,4-cyclodiphosphate synthase